MNRLNDEPVAEVLSLEQRPAEWSRWLFPALFAFAFCLEYVGTHLPVRFTVRIPQIAEYDKQLHCSAYLLLSILAGLRLVFLRQLSVANWVCWGVGLGALAVVDEVSQIPFGRDCGLGDWCADLIGIVTGLILTRGFGHFFHVPSRINPASWTARNRIGMVGKTATREQAKAA